MEYVHPKAPELEVYGLWTHRVGEPSARNVPINGWLDGCRTILDDAVFGYTRTFGSMAVEHSGLVRFRCTGYSALTIDCSQLPGGFFRYASEAKAPKKIK